MQKTNDYIKLAALAAVALLGITVVFSSCSLSKKVENAYEVVGTIPPITNDDSANFYKRAQQMIKPVTPTIKKSDTIRVPYPVEVLKKVLDTNVQKMLLDSLEAAYKQFEKYNDEDCKLREKKAIETGYARAQYENYIKGYDSITPEIQYIPDPATLLMLDDYKSKLAKTQSDLLKAVTQRDIYKGASSKKNWVLAGLLLALGGIAFFKIKSAIKPKIFIDNIKNTV